MGKMIANMPSSYSYFYSSCSLSRMKVKVGTLEILSTPHIPSILLIKLLQVVKILT